MADDEGVECPFCGSTNTEHRGDYEDAGDVDGGVDEGAPIYKCDGCLSYFPGSAAAGVGGDGEVLD